MKQNLTNAIGSLKDNCQKVFSHYNLSQSGLETFKLIEYKKLRDLSTVTAALEFGALVCITVFFINMQIQVSIKTRKAPKRN